MTIKFLYGRRESLTGKAEAYKKAVRAYLESLGHSQTTDSIVEGTFEDMVFYNPTIAPGRRFVIEAKAENVSLKSKILARELVKYFRLWRNRESEDRFKFMLFVQAVKRPNEWELLFSEVDNILTVRKWCKWYNEKFRKMKESLIERENIPQFAKFLCESEVIVGNKVRLELAIIERERISTLAIPRIGKKLLKIVDKRRAPIMKKSSLMMNVLPINVPDCYFTCCSTAASKTEIYDSLRDALIPPFIWRRDRSMMSFAEFDKDNPLLGFVKGSITVKKTKELQYENPPLSAHLVNIHLRRIIWNRGLYRDKEIFYFPMLDKTKSERLEIDRNNRKRWVVKKLIATRDTKYAKEGETNFFFHRAVELRTPTYWGTSYIELTPRRYYTLDGETPTKGEIRAAIDRKFRTPYYDRSKSRMGLMRFWRFLLFESENYRFPPEKWFDRFKFGGFVTKPVDWSPMVIGRHQTRLWDFEEVNNA